MTVGVACLAILAAPASGVSATASGTIRPVPEVGDPGVRGQEGEELACPIPIPKELSPSQVREIAVVVRGLSDKPIRSIERRARGKYDVTTIVDGTCEVGRGESIIVSRRGRKWNARRSRSHTVWDRLAVAPPNRALNPTGQRPAG
jgi:hypothetical protein